MSCAYANASGEKCQANAMKNSQFCFVHNPATREEHALAVVKGGKMSRRDKLNLPPVQMKNPEDIISILEETVNGIRSGSIPPQTANTIAYICSHALRAFEVSKLNDKVELIQRVILEKKTKY